MLPTTPVAEMGSARLLGFACAMISITEKLANLVRKLKKNLICGQDIAEAQRVTIHSEGMTGGGLAGAVIGGLLISFVFIGGVSAFQSPNNN